MPCSSAAPPWLVRVVGANADQASSSSSSKGGALVLTAGTTTMDTGATAAGYYGGGGAGCNAADPQESSSSGQSRLAARGHWRPAEDAKLRELVALYGPQNWNLIAEKLDGRSGADGASGDDDGAGWRPLEVRVSSTSRPPGDSFRSKVFRKLRRRRVFDTASSPATSTQKDRAHHYI